MLPKIKSPRSLSEQAYLVIKDAILKNQIKPKDVLQEETLAASLGISRTPLSAALKKLEFEKLVYMNSSKQAVVAEVREEDMAKIFELRFGIEPLLIKLACRRITPEGFSLLEDNLRSTEQALQQGELIEVLSCEMEFDKILADISGNEYIADSIDMIATHLQRYFVLSTVNLESTPKALAEHREMLDALKAGDCAKAEKLCREHLHRVAERLNLPIPADIIQI